MSIFNVLAYPVEHWTWDDLINKSYKQNSSANHEPTKTFYLGNKPLLTTLQLDLSSPKIKKGGFKIAAFGISTTSLFKSSATQDVCAKRTYYTEERVTEHNGSLVTKTTNVPHDSQKQVQNLSMEVACVVWAQALLDIVYEFVAEAITSHGQPPFHIPQFCFVESALAMEHSLDDNSRAGQKKAVFLVEEVIADDREGPFRKYLNNVSPVPLSMNCKEDGDRGKFLVTFNTDPILNALY